MISTKKAAGLTPGGGVGNLTSGSRNLANTVTQVQQVQKGRWVLMKDGLMF